MMTNKKEITEGRLKAALDRILEGKPQRIELKGKLTLNKINNEAGLSNSYIHKFKGFIEYAEPIIKNYNQGNSGLFGCSVIINNEKLSELELCKINLAKEIKLKEKYRQNAKDKEFMLKSLTKKYNSLLFRILELQEELDLNNLNKVKNIN